MRRFDQKGLAAGSLYMVTGVAAALGSMQYSIGSFWRMGPGFFPLMVSLGLILVGVVVALIAVAPAAPAIPLDRWRLRNLGLITVAVLLFSALIRPGGVILASAAMVAVAGLAARGAPSGSRRAP